MEQFAGNVINYFEDTYIGRLRPGGHHRAPLFDLALWNMYDQTIGDLPRTNNAVRLASKIPSKCRSISSKLPEIYRHLEAETKSKPCQHFTSSSWPSTRASTSSLSRHQPMNKEYRPRLPQQGQIAVSPWPRPQHQYVTKQFFQKPPNYRLYATQNGSFKNHQHEVMPTMHYFIDPCLMYFTAKNQIEISFP